MENEVTAKPLADSNLTIIGLGLMGASLALAVRGKVRSLCGVDRDPVTRQLAAAVCDRVTDDLAVALADAEIVILATPARAILALLTQIAQHLKPGTFVFDLGSTKSQIVAAMAGLPDGIYALGGHPMCGKETSGFAAADPTLYNGCTFALCDAGRSRPEYHALAVSMVALLGGRPLWLDATTHDQYVAIVSHLPYLLSMGLVAEVAENPARDSLFALASTGFRDTTRLAGSDLSMMSDVMATNTDAIWHALAGLQSQLTVLLAAFSNDRAADQAWLRAIRERRREWGEHFAAHSRKG